MAGAELCRGRRSDPRLAARAGAGSVRATRLQRAGQREHSRLAVRSPRPRPAERRPHGL